MKVVLFCGGQGTRLRSGVAPPPKPMTLLGGRPLIWHVMRYYAAYGHREFVLCLGHRGEQFQTWLDAERATDPTGLVAAWDVQLADTGEHTVIGQRLVQVEPLLHPGEPFLANYGDTLTDAPLDDVIARFLGSDAVVSLLAVRPQDSFHLLDLTGSRVDGIRPVTTADLWQNGGGFVMRPAVFGAIRAGEDLAEEPLARLAAAGRLMAYRYEGFWAPMDTVKDRLRLEMLWEAGSPPWAVWEGPATTPPLVLAPVV